MIHPHFCGGLPVQLCYDAHVLHLLHRLHEQAMQQNHTDFVQGTSIALAIIIVVVIIVAAGLGIRKARNG